MKRRWSRPQGIAGRVFMLQAGLLLVILTVALVLIFRPRARQSSEPGSPGLASGRTERRPTPGSGPAASDASLPAEITFSEHIAPIVFSHCSKCHRPGEAGPFPLLNYADVASRGDLVRAVTQSRYMPPWPADPGYRHFVGENVLTEREIALIGRWATQGAPRGDPSRQPKPPTFPKGSQLGTPDLVVRMPGPYRIAGDATDKFLSMKLPFSIPNDTFVRAIEFVPGNRKLVHHVNAHLVTFPDGTRRDLTKGRWYVKVDPEHAEALEQLDLRGDNGSSAPITLSVANYLPGALPTLYPEGIGGFRLSRKGYLLLHHIHYGPSTSNQTDQSYFNIFFDSLPPRRPTYTLLLGTLGRSPVVPPLVVPPDSVKTFRTQFTLPADISVLTINPHMHLLGKTFLAYAVTPSGETIPLIRINHWDFRWQYFYTFEKILKLTRGTTIYAEASFDNTVNNPNNPFHPPQVVREQGGSMRTTDEMFQCIITMMPYQEGDENISLSQPGIP
jgi:copper type II ascorbate-dependent monooxygenase-like protein